MGHVLGIVVSLSYLLLYPLVLPLSVSLFVYILLFVLYLLKREMFLFYRYNVFYYLDILIFVKIFDFHRTLTRFEGSEERGRIEGELEERNRARK